MSTIERESVNIIPTSKNNPNKMSKYTQRAVLALFFKQVLKPILFNILIELIFTWKMCIYSRSLFFTHLIFLPHK